MYNNRIFKLTLPLLTRWINGRFCCVWDNECNIMYYEHVKDRNDVLICEQHGIDNLKKIFPNIIEQKTISLNCDCMSLDVQHVSVKMDDEYFVTIIGTDLNHNNDIIENALNEMVCEYYKERDIKSNIFNLAVQNIVDGFVIINHKGVIQSVNDTTTKLFGYAKSELIGQNVSLIVSPLHAEKHDMYISNYLRTGKAKIMGKGRKLTAIKKDGSIFPIYLTIIEKH